MWVWNQPRSQWLSLASVNLRVEGGFSSSDLGRKESQQGLSVTGGPSRSSQQFKRAGQWGECLAGRCRGGSVGDTKWKRMFSGQGEDASPSQRREQGEDPRAQQGGRTFQRAHKWALKCKVYFWMEPLVSGTESHTPDTWRFVLLPTVPTSSRSEVRGRTAVGKPQGSLLSGEEIQAEMWFRGSAKLTGELTGLCVGTGGRQRRLSSESLLGSAQSWSRSSLGRTFFCPSVHPRVVR